MTFTIIVFSQVAQRLVTRYGVRSVLTAGLLLDSVSLAMFTQLPADGHYFWNLFPGMVVGGVGLALSFVPVTIAGLTGVEPGGRGHRVGPHQHEPPGRRRGGPRGGLDDHDGIYATDGSAAAVQDEPHQRLPGGIPGAFRRRASGRRHRGDPARPAAGAR